jgi:sec-independent protein translocase protein TatB
MFGLSFGEIVIIAVLALLLLGPDRLPEAMKTVGKHFRDFRKATDDLKDQIEGEIYRDERKAAMAPRPSLVPPVPAATTRPPTDPPGPPPPATAANVPGLEAALDEPAPAAPAPAPAVAAEPEPAAPPAASPTGTVA